MIPNKTIRKWENPFRNEQDVLNNFIGHVDQLLSLEESLEKNLSKSRSSLLYAKRKHASSVSDGKKRKINVFIAPAAQAAIEITDALQQAGKWQDTFWACNVFGEFCKISLEINRGKYQNIFEHFLKLACYAMTETWVSNSDKQSNEKEIAELISLRNQLQVKCCDNAIGTYFEKRSGRFIRTNRPDTALSERILSNSLARHFDKQLCYMLEHDRPRVKDYISKNMPIVYRMELPEEWAIKRKEWEEQLKHAGYEDTLRTLTALGELVSIDEIGQLSTERFEDVKRAYGNNDLERVIDLLKDSANEVKSYLYKEAQERLDYREPVQPTLTQGRLIGKFKKVQKLTSANDPDSLRKSLEIAQEVWRMNVRDIKLREWVAFLQAKTGNLPAAEEMFEQIRKRKDTKQNFYTDWNLAVMAYDRKDEAMAYQFLVPLLDQNAYDEDLIWIVLALAIKLEDRERFLATIPKSLTMRFHPLAIVVSYNFGDQSRTQELLGEFLRQTSWQLPPVNRRFNNLAELEKIIDEGIVEGQIEQLVSWLEARIVSHKGWIPNYLALARVYEEECQDVENAFKILRNRLRIVQNDNKQDKRKKDDACRDLLELCKRNKYKKLGEQAFQLAIKACTSKDLLNSFKNFAPKENEAIVDQAKPDPPPQIVTPLRQTDPQLAERLAWVTARFASVRNIATYVEEQKALDQFVRIVTEMNPEESGSVVDKINNISTVVQRFFSTEVGDHDARRVLYTRAIGFEESLTKLLNSGVLSQNLTDIITPYHAALKKVLGDLSRQAGIGPKIDVVIENPFISNETEKSTLVIKATNESQRQVSDVQIELLADNSILNIAGNKNSIISNLNSQQSAFINFPIRCNGMKSNNGSSNIPVDISIQASAEGFPNVDLGIIKRRIPIKTFKEFIGAEQIPKKFQKVALNPSEPDLFQGRDDIMKKIKNSFSGGIQRERYFLDGIRRTGKTSILNFLPRSLPENVIPVLINLDTFGLTAGPIDSPSFLHGICGLMCESMMSGTNNGNEIHPPDKEAFVSNPGQAFNQFLTDFKTKTDGKVPLLMIDEFQTLLEAIARTGSGINRDTLVLDQLRGHLDQGNLYATMTGSVRFDRLSQITDHRIFGSLTRLRVTFLAEESVKQVLHAGLEQWVKIPDETVRKVYQLTGGYPWLIQDYGANLVDLLNDEHRTIATEKDIELITEESILCNNEHFKHWWPTNQLSSEEERFIEELFRKYPDQENVETREFFGSIHHREQPAFRRAFENLRACEVLDSTQTEKLSFRGTVLRRWLEQQIQSDGRLRIRVDYQEKPNTDRGKTGVFIDHENLIKSLERISAARGKTYSKNKLDWFSHILKNLLSEAENRVGMLGFKVAVAFWNRPEESNLQSAYFDNGFTPAQPENVKLENAVDFKVADEVRRANEQAMREKTWLSRAIIVTGDGDLSHIVRALVNDRVAVQVWAGSKETSNQYQKIVGEENIVALDDVCGL